MAKSAHSKFTRQDSINLIIGLKIAESIQISTDDIKIRQIHQKLSDNNSQTLRPKLLFKI